MPFFVGVREKKQVVGFLSLINAEPSSSLDFLMMAKQFKKKWQTGTLNIVFLFKIYIGLNVLKL